MSVSDKPKKSGIVVPQPLKWHGKLAALLVYILGTALAATLRVRVRDESGMFEPNSSGAMIGALWHNRLALSMMMWRWVQKRRKVAGLAALISASKDGALLAQVLRHFGVKPIRGSSSRRGAQAMLESTTALQEGYAVAITPDGPRGPKYQVQDGIIALAQHTGAPILPAGGRIQWVKRLRSWDQFQLPLPFSLCEIYFGQPLHVPPDASDEDREKFRVELERRLSEINQALE